MENNYPDKNYYHSLNGVDYIEIGKREAIKAVSVCICCVTWNCTDKCAASRCGCFMVPSK